jgi:predicted nucleic acid-binding protein
LFIDTWGWLVLVDAGDSSHDAVVRLRRQSEQGGLPWVTTDYVLDEAITRAFTLCPFPTAERFWQSVFQAREAGFLAIQNITSDLFEKAYELRLQYRDNPRISFTDFTSFVVMKELGLHRVLTGDAHFVHAGMGFERVP